MEANPISWLNALTQARRLPVPVYRYWPMLTEDFRWKVTVKVEGFPIQAAFGRTKKSAKQGAAAVLLRKMAK